MQSGSNETRVDLAEVTATGPLGGPNAAPQPDLASLVDAARQGDSIALQRLYGCYRPLLRGIVAELRSRLPAGLDPDDLAQETARHFCELVRAFDPAQGTNLTTYLQRKLRWRVVNFLRAEKRRAGHLRLEAAQLDRLAEEMGHARHDDLASPRLARALRRLSPRQRTVIAGIYWQERRAGELARQLGITPQAVTALRRRAEAALRREFLEG